MKKKDKIFDDNFLWRPT